MMIDIHKEENIMSRRKTGALLIVTASILYAARFVTAAIFGSGMSSWNAELFDALLEYVGPELVIASAIALALGLVYLIWGEIKVDQE
jgi:ornithine cyclodeaminase/alanine dehydrogenase-like protein (mu-crystallin family)